MHRWSTTICANHMRPHQTSLTHIVKTNIEVNSNKRLNFKQLFKFIACFSALFGTLTANLMPIYTSLLFMGKGWTLAIE